ncbi:MAG: zinc-dependent metalloprotease family protein [Acidobacteriota bacterium]
MIVSFKAAACFGMMCLFAILGCAQTSFPGDGIWQERDDAAIAKRPLQRTRTPDHYRTFELNKDLLRRKLAASPEESRDSPSNLSIEIPMPNGKTARFRLEHSLVVEQGLADKYPELTETYRGYGIDDPLATVRLDYLPSGFHAMILSPNGTVMVDPYAIGDTDNYISYFKSDLPRSDGFTCEVGEKTFDNFLTSGNLDQSELVSNAEGVISGTQLRTYRLALAATNEYAVAVGGNTIAGTLAAQVLIMNRVNGIYERDLAIHMNMVANNNLIVYAGDQLCGGTACTAANDPYTNSDGSSMLSENTTNLTLVLGTGGYDIGHVFSTGGGGIATLNGPCGSNKARGVTGQSNPVGDGFAVDYVAHEMGHQFGANHTFNGSVSNCGSNNRSSTTAYEPGSGITVMAYAGICGNQDLALHSIDTFHIKSLEEIVAYSQTGNGNSCAVKTATGDTPPSVSVVGGPTFNIPKQTPFTLTASASDIDGDSVTYDWQEYDLGAPTLSVPNTDSGGAMPIFRPYAPSVKAFRTFPSLPYILNNSNLPPSTYDCGRGVGTPCLTGELLPQIGRTMTFQIAARDNRAGGGGVSTASVLVVVDGSSGPFTVTSPNTSVSYPGNTVQTITWNVANTSNAPVNSANVRISLSTDGGNTFPTLLAASTPNDGSESVMIPNIVTSTARVKVESASGIFFDISDINFSITAGNAAATHAVSDFDGDGISDISVWRENDGVWYRINSSNGLFGAFKFGAPGDEIVPGDYDGDGKTDFAVWRPSTGVWYIQASTAGFSAIQFGVSSDLPSQGDFDGDGKTDISVFRPSTGLWYMLRSSAGFTGVQFGVAGDKPVAADFDGDGKTDVAVYRPSTGIWYKLGSTAGFSAVAFGVATDKVVPADFDGDGKADPAVFRDSEGVWYLLGSSAGFSAMRFGSAGDIPVPADYDGDGKTDIGMFRPSDGGWYRLNSSNGSFSAISFGTLSDRPAAAGYLPIQ